MPVSYGRELSMSELINNREVRKETIKNIIKELHEGKQVEEVKAEFEKTGKLLHASHAAVYQESYKEKI